MIKIFFLFFALVGIGFSIPIIEEPRWNPVTIEGRTFLIDVNPIEIEEEPNPSYDPLTDIIFFLHTRRNPTQGQILDTFNMDSVRNSNWDVSQGVRFIIHGFNALGANVRENPIITRALLDFADHNVVVIDWSAGAGTPNYVTARRRAAPTGAAIALFINRLVAANLTTFNQVQLIGHSLGSHVAGNVGKNVVGGRIQAIFATDPAGPLYNRFSRERLAEDDAVYTEAIHTNAGETGMGDPITHAAFYPHYGRRQPGCENVPEPHWCDHARSNDLFAESINRPLLIGRQCRSYRLIPFRLCLETGFSGVMGGDQPKNLRGVFVLETNAIPPYGLG